MQINISGSVLASYLLFYTAYDKKTKTLVPSNLLDFFFARKGYEWTIVEANKALSLSGLPTMMVAFLAEFQDMKKDLLWISMVTLWGHSSYSFYKFYQLDIRKVISEKIIKKSSILLGAGALLSLALGYFEQFSFLTLAVPPHCWVLRTSIRTRLITSMCSRCARLPTCPFLWQAWCCTTCSPDK